MSRAHKDPPADPLNEREEGWAVPINRVDAFTSGAAMAVDVGQIERELQALWRQAAERAQDAGSGLAVVRACLWNFIVHKRGEATFAPLKAMIDEVSQVVPARVIVLLERLESGEWSGEEPLRAFVEANTRPGPGGRRELVSEEITLEAPRLEAARLPALVRSLLLADLPTAVFLSGAAPDADRLGPLLAEADRIVIDSGRLAPGYLRQMMRALAGLDLGDGGAASATATEVTDLGWLRTASWRRLVASLFDEAPEALEAIDEVQIDHAPGADAAALLCAGWLVARLRWTHEGGDLSAREVALRDAAGRPIRLTVTTVDGRRAPGGLAAVTLRAGGELFRATGAGTETSPCIEIERPRLPPRALPVQERRDGELLVRALGAFGRDPLLLCALRAALHLVPASSASTPSMAPGGPRHGGANLSYP